MSAEFLAPQRLWLLIVVVALAVAYLAALRWRRGAQVRFTDVDLLDEVVPQRPSWRRHVVAVLMLAGLAGLVVAAARPVDRRTERLAAEGRILVLFDVSLSMMAEDVAPDRFVAAREAALEFVAAVEPDVQIGLVSFSGAVAVESAPTLNRDQTARAIESLRLGEGTAIGDALAVGTRLLTVESDDNGVPGDLGDPDTPEPDRDTERAPGVIVLLTDGETTMGRPTVEGAELAAEAGVPVYAISFGTATGSIADPGGSGQRIPVPVRTDEIEAVAEITGGAAYAAESLDALGDAYDDIRDSLGETLGEQVEVVDERTWWWALTAFALVSLAWALALWWLRGLV